MKNHEVAEVLEEIGDLLAIQGSEYKPRAYRRAAGNVGSLTEPIEEYHERGELQEIDGVGESIAEKIAEYLETGEVEYRQQLKSELPIDIESITAVEGVGPETAETFYRELGVTDLEELERAARDGRIADLEGFGEASQQNVLDGIELAKRGRERTLLGRASPIAETVRSRLVDAEAFDRVDVVGSFRRRRPTVGDIDVLATADDPAAATEVFCTQEDVEQVLSRGPTKSSVVVADDLRIDLRIVEVDEYGAGLVYFTGSKEHNIALRRRAIDRDWKLNEYGLFDVSDVEDPDVGPRVGDTLATDSEGAIYAALELSWVPPELRENTGEIEVAADDELPELVETDDVRGDLHVHTDGSDGTASVREMATAADERGLEYLAITDHGPNAPFPDALDESAFERQRDEIRAVNEDEGIDITVLQGIEAEITADGVDIPDEWLDACDLVVGGMHTRPADPTGVVLEAIDAGRIDLLAHPTARLIQEREPLALDLDRVVARAAEAGVAIEINGRQDRLDLDWAHVKEYRHRTQFVVSSDARAVDELAHLDLAVDQARRGWCEADDVANTATANALLEGFTG